MKTDIFTTTDGRKIKAYIPETPAERRWLRRTFPLGHVGGIGDPTRDFPELFGRRKRRSKK